MQIQQLVQELHILMQMVFVGAAIIAGAVFGGIAGAFFLEEDLANTQQWEEDKQTLTFLLFYFYS